MIGTKFLSTATLLFVAVLLLYSCSNTGGSSTFKYSESEVVQGSEEMNLSLEMDESQSNTEEYDRIYENSFKDAVRQPLSTFSIDVDNASYTNVRRFITQSSTLPPPDAVRIEEMINYFDYDYEEPDGRNPFSINAEVARCPWNLENQLVQIGLQGKSLDLENLGGSNLVFLIDVSGSMDSPNKLALVKKSLKLLVNELAGEDKVALVVYAGSAGLVLPATSVSEQDKILRSIQKLEAGGSTAGRAGIELAYGIAEENLIPHGNNRVILCTDGDFNIGTSSTSELVRLIEEKRKQNIYLTICGFGMGNYKDGRMEQISNAGNGNYFYIDHLKEAVKVFGKEMMANLFTIAKDVKIQVEFNPAYVKGYRLIGYENRVMQAEDFNDDQKDAGELGAGHTVTALYEIIPVGSNQNIGTIDELKYQTNESGLGQLNREMLTVKLRYKPLESSSSIVLEETLPIADHTWEESSTNMQFASAVAGFGLVLRQSKYKGDLTYDKVLLMARASDSEDPEGYRSEFRELVRTASLLAKN